MTSLGTFLEKDQRQTRQRLLIAHVERNGFISVGEIEAALGISLATVRRDLADLERDGRIRRTRGGAIPADMPAWRRPDAERTVLNLAEKRAIAVAAATLIGSGERVFIDSGTTALEFTRLLAARRDLTLLTNGLGIAHMIETAQHPNFFFVGGEFHPHNRSFIGASACRAIEKFHVDTAVLCTASIDLDRKVITMPDPAMADTQRSMIRSAGRTIVVADHTKFRSAALCVVAVLAAIAAIVTGGEAEPALEDRVAEAGSRLVRACRQGGGEP